MRLSEFRRPGPPPTPAPATQTPEQVVEILQRDCQPFLQATNNLEYRLYRGIRSIVPFDGKLIKEAACPVGRRPKDSPMFLHRVADQWFFNETGIAFRSNSVFCTGNNAEAIEYGTVYLMIPLGNFDFCWSPNVEDLYRKFDQTRYHSYNADAMVGEALYDKESLIHDLDHSKYRFNSSVNDFRSGIVSGNEMMIHCDQYYIMPYYDEQTTKVLSLL